MTDMPDERQIDEAAPEKGPDEISGSFVVSMFGEDETLKWPGSDGEFFIRAVRADIDGEDRISNAGMKLAMKQNVKATGDVTIGATMNPGATYLEKCVVQIRDYRIPVKEQKRTSGGVEVQEVVKTFDSSHDGDNPANRKLYSYMADKRLLVPVLQLSKGELAYLGDDITKTKITMMELVDGFLDYVSGRTTDAAGEFKELGNALLA